MGFFSGPEEDARRRKLTEMENKRLAFAGEMARVGFGEDAASVHGARQSHRRLPG